MPNFLLKMKNPVASLVAFCALFILNKSSLPQLYHIYFCFLNIHAPQKYTNVLQFWSVPLPSWFIKNGICICNIPFCNVFQISLFFQISSFCELYHQDSDAEDSIFHKPTKQCHIHYTTKHVKEKRQRVIYVIKKER